MSVRFAVLAAPTGHAAEWSGRVRALEAGGWDTVLVPDTLRTLSPFAALAAAAAATTTLRLRPWVLAAPLRTPGALVREARALQQLSDGRFELGIGTGRPDAEQEAAALGAGWGTPGERIAALEAAVAAVREQVRPAPPVAVAAGGPRALAVAARIADRVAPAQPPTATTADLAAAVERVREAASGRVAPPAITQVIIGVNGVLQPWLARQGLDAATLAAKDAAGILTGDTDELAAVLRDRQERWGIDEFVVYEEFTEVLAPVAAALRGDPRP